MAESTASPAGTGEADAPYTTQRFAAHFVGRVFDQLIEAVADLDGDELHALPPGAPNTIGFTAWHVFRSADNVVLFAFERAEKYFMKSLEEDPEDESTKANFLRLLEERRGVGN